MGAGNRKAEHRSEGFKGFSGKFQMEHTDYTQCTGEGRARDLRGRLRYSASQPGGSQPWGSPNPRRCSDCRTGDWSHSSVVTIAILSAALVV